MDHPSGQQAQRTAFEGNRRKRWRFSSDSENVVRKMREAMFDSEAEVRFVIKKDREKNKSDK